MARLKEKNIKDELLELVKARSEAIHGLKQYEKKTESSDLLTSMYQKNIRDLEISIADKLYELFGDEIKNITPSG